MSVHSRSSNDVWCTYLFARSARNTRIFMLCNIVLNESVQRDAIWLCNMNVNILYDCWDEGYTRMNNRQDAVASSAHRRICFRLLVLMWYTRAFIIAEGERHRIRFRWQVAKWSLRLLWEKNQNGHTINFSIVFSSYYLYNTKYIVNHWTSWYAFIQHNSIRNKTKISSIKIHLLLIDSDSIWDTFKMLSLTIDFMMLSALLK